MSDPHAVMVGTAGRNPAGRWRWRYLGGVVAGIVALAPLSRPLAAQGGAPVGTLIEPFAVPDLAGEPFDLATVIGRKPVLIQFWATWCSVCEALMPALRAAGARYGDRVEFLGVNVTVNQTPDRVRRYLEEHNPPFRTLYDRRGVAVRALDVPATGFVVILDATGRVAYTGSGERQDLVAALGRVVP